MPQHDIVVIGASAGGLQALTALIEGLPPTLPAAVLIVMHMRANGNVVLPRILERISALPVAFAKHGEELRPGRIYVSRPDRHLLVTGSSIRLDHGPRENGFRPAIDPLFRTAARAYGPRVIGVVLSGALSDGTYGLSVIKHHGGVSIVQDPADAIMPHMPQSAIKAVEVDHVLPAAEIAGLIGQLSREDVEGEGDMARRKELEPQLLSEETQVSTMQERFGPPSPLTCPDCGGTLWEVEEGQLVRYQCHVGHQFSPAGLENEHRDAVESALWSAVRVLEEHAELKMRLARRAAHTGMSVVSQGFAEGAHDAHRQAQEIRAVLFTGNGFAKLDTQTLADADVAVGNPGKEVKASPNGSKRSKPSKRKAKKPAKLTAGASGRVNRARRGNQQT